MSPFGPFNFLLMESLGSWRFAFIWALDPISTTSTPTCFCSFLLLTCFCPQSPSPVRQLCFLNVTEYVASKIVPCTQQVPPGHSSLESRFPAIFVAMKKSSNQLASRGHPRAVMYFLSATSCIFQCLLTGWISLLILLIALTTDSC